MEGAEVPALMCARELSRLVYLGTVGVAGFSKIKKAAEHGAIHMPSQRAKQMLFT